MIQNRRLWKEQTEQMLPGHGGDSNVVYDEAGNRSLLRPHQGTYRAT